MTYRSNVEALLARENINSRQVESNVNFKINEIKRQEKESIANIQKVESLLIGNQGERFQAGLKGGEITDEGILPWWYGRHVRGKYKEGDEAADKDREDKLARLASMSAKLTSLKDQDTEYHRIKQQMLLNGAYYEDADRFTKLSPHAQVAYAQNKLNLYNETIESKLSLWMSKDNTELDVNGQKYTPASVTGIPLAPLALKEHALNVGLDKIRSDNGINGFNKDFLELAGTDLAEKKAKKSLMSKYRSQYDIDSSYNTRLQQIKEFMVDGEYDFNRLLTVFAGTKGANGELLGYKGAWDEAMKLLKSMGVSGNLPDAALERMKNTVNPNDRAGRTFGVTHKFRFDKLEADINRQIESNVQGQLLEDKVKRDQLQLTFKNYVDKLNSESKVMDERDLAFFRQKYEEFGGQGEPKWLQDYETIQDQDDEKQLDYLNGVYRRRGFITEDDLWGMSGEVRRIVSEADGILTKSNESGAATGQQLLEQKGEGSITDDLEKMINTAIRLSGFDPESFSTFTALTNARNHWQNRYNFYRTEKDYDETAAAGAALDDVQHLLDTGENGLFKNNSPVEASVIFQKPATPTETYLKTRDNGVEFIQKGLIQNGDTRFLATKEGLIEGTTGPGGALEQSIAYFKGEGTLPKIYIDIADQFPGITGDKLARWQLTAALTSGAEFPGDIDIDSLLKDSQAPVSAAWEALDMELHQETARLLGFKTTPFSTCQAKACINDQLTSIRRNQPVEQGGFEEQEGDGQVQKGKIIDNKEGHIQVPSGGETKTEAATEDLTDDIDLQADREAKTPFLTKLIKQRLDMTNQPKGVNVDDVLEAQIRTSTNLESDKEIINKYYGGGKEYKQGGSSDDYAKLKYTLAQQLNQSGALGADGELATGVQALFNKKGELDLGQLGTKSGGEPVVYGEINHEAANQLVEDLLSYEMDKTSVERFSPLTGNWLVDKEMTWVKNKIEAGELELVPTIDGKDVSTDDAIKYSKTPQIQFGFGIGTGGGGINFNTNQGVLPSNLKYRMIDLTKEPENNLQSSLNVAGSPYLADHLQAYAGQLIAFNVGTDPTIPLTLDKATDDNSRWNWVVDQARKAGAQYPELVAAQFMLESGYGANVSGTHNYFGLKTTSTDPDSTWLETSEYKNGKWVKVMAPFKNFDSPEAAIQYLSRLWYKDFGAYKGANNALDINGAIDVLVQGGYATDPKYREKLLQILKEFEKSKSKPRQTITA